MKITRFVAGVKPDTKKGFVDATVGLAFVATLYLATGDASWAADAPEFINTLDTKAGEAEAGVSKLALSLGVIAMMVAAAVGYFKSQVKGALIGMMSAAVVLAFIVLAPKVVEWATTFAT